jgi:hypothetical protein
MQSTRVVAGSGGLEIILNGLYLTPADRLLVAEFDPDKRAYNHLQFLPFEFIDLYHVKVSVPSFLLQQPRVLVFSVMRPLDDRREQEPAFDGTFKSWLPGTSHYNATLIVARPESPAVDRLEPTELRADADEFKAQPEPKRNNPLMTNMASTCASAARVLTATRRCLWGPIRSATTFANGTCLSP